MRNPIRRLVLLLVLAAAWALRLYRLDAQSLWYDEAVTARVAGQGLAELTRWTANDIQPPLYYYLEAATTALLGRSEWALRALSAAMGLLAVAVMVALARRLFGRRAGRRRRAAGGRLPPLRLLQPGSAHVFAAGAAVHGARVCRAARHGRPG